MMKLGVVDVGGGLRGVYAAGVFDYCLDHGIRFDLGIGVSAGSANVAAYIAGQAGRNYLFFTEYPFRTRYMSIRNFLLKRSYIDLDYVYGTLSNSDGENPLDYEALMRNPAEFIVVACNAQTGEAKYFDKTDMGTDDYSILKASSAIPFICKPYKVKGIAYYDGALGDPVPVEKAFQMGCDKVVLILTRPKNILRSIGHDGRFADMIQKKYPLSAERLRKRAERYNDEVARAKEYEAMGRVLIVAPDDTCGADTLSKDKEALKRFYAKGYCDAQAIQTFFQAGIHSASQTTPCIPL